VLSLEHKKKNRKIEFASRILTAHKNNILSTYLEPYFLSQLACIDSEMTLQCHRVFAAVNLHAPCVAWFSDNNINYITMLRLQKHMRVQWWLEVLDPAINILMEVKNREIAIVSDVSFFSREFYKIGLHRCQHAARTILNAQHLHDRVF